MVENSGKTYNFQFVALLQIFKKERKFILLFNLAVLVLLFVVSYFIPHKYTSFATLLPTEESGSSGLSSFLQNFTNISFIGSRTSTKVQMYYEMLRSNELIAYTSQNPAVAKLPLLKGLDSTEIANLIYKGLDVNLRQSGLIEINFSLSTSFFPGKPQKTEVAKTSAIILKVVLETLDSLVRSRVSTRSHRKRVLIEELLADRKKQLDSIENALETFREKNKILAFDEQSQAILGSAIEIGAELARAEVDLQLALTEYEPNAPIVKSLQEKVQKLRNQYERVQSGGLTGKETFSIPLTKVPALVREYTSLVRKQKILEQVNLFLETQHSQETIQEQTEIPSVDVLDNPRIPEYQSFPNRPLMLLIAFILSFVFSVAFVIVRSIKKKELTFASEPFEEEELLQN